jgi:hypothetical protein
MALGVTLNANKTRIVHVSHGFEFLGYKIKHNLIVGSPWNKSD